MFVLLSPRSFGQASKPVAEWSFDETEGAVAHDSAGGIDDAITGNFRHVNGVTGHGLRFDGTSTVVTRNRKSAPHLTVGVTVDAWVAIDAYPWNWVPIVDHRSEEQAGYWFGIDSFGHVGMNVAVDGQWWTLFSKAQVPLKKWSHVAGSYDPAKGMAIYIDGKPVGELSVQGTSDCCRAGRPGHRESSSGDAPRAMDSSQASGVVFVRRNHGRHSHLRPQSRARGNCKGLCRRSSSLR